jgi:hypothetical protein
MFRASLAAALLFAIPSFADATAPCPAIARVKVTVEGQRTEWTRTSLKVEKGDVIMVEATGKVNVGHWYGEVGPDGVHNSNHAGRLDLQIGNGEIEPIGEHAFLVAKEAGEVTLHVNDRIHDDNTGAYEVVVTRIPASAMPEPQAATSAR